MLPDHSLLGLLYIPDHSLLLAIGRPFADRIPVWWDGMVPLQKVARVWPLKGFWQWIHNSKRVLDGGGSQYGSRLSRWFSVVLRMVLAMGGGSVAGFAWWFSLILRMVCGRRWLSGLASWGGWWWLWLAGAWWVVFSTSVVFRTNQKQIFRIFWLKLPFFSLPRSQ